MDEIKSGVLGVLDAALKYFDEYSTELTEKAKQHIGKKSQDMQTELYEKKYRLEDYLAQLRSLEEEKTKVELSCHKAQLKKSQLLYFNQQLNREIFNLQEKIFELETGNG